ncbi:porin family protein [Bacteroides sp. 51]|uniref:porin family protein n=1 Tax=Bacteroides sp. 51 TaxID=2302938 RepID=UPI0013CF7172|nr:porin family protein [Bacteroides sp. 51]NDV82664.1 PorT family protein [Bacteroides sp. 51]
MKRILSLFILSLFVFPTFAQLRKQEAVERILKPNNKAFNFGVRVGFNSSMYLVSDFKIKDVTIDDIQNNYRIGGFVALFGRFNISRHYIQPEISYQISRSEISFDKLGSQHPAIEPDYASIHAKIHSIEFPVLYGFNIIKKGPYAMSVFAGPKAKFLWKQKNEITFENFEQKDMEEELYPLCLSGVLGVGVNVSRIFFDFRYEQGLTNISKTVTYENMPSTKDDSNNIIFRRREAILSFSLGVMF